MFAAFIFFSFLCPLYIKHLLSERIDLLFHSAMMLNIRFYSAQMRVGEWDCYNILLKLDSGQTSKGKTAKTAGGDATP